MTTCTARHTTANNHCWHLRSMAMSTMDEFTKTFVSCMDYVCCFCGEAKREESLVTPPMPSPHGPFAPYGI